MTGSIINNIGTAIRPISVTPISIAPTINPIPNPATIVENTITPIVVPLSGITAGGGQLHNLTVTATSNNDGTESPTSTVTYIVANTTGQLSFTPNPNQVGTALISVTVMSDGSTANGGVNTTTISFTVTVGGINQPPSLNLIANPAPILENTNTPQTVSLSNITAGVGDTGQIVTVSALSSNPNLIPNPAVTYVNPGTTGSLWSAIFRCPMSAARRRSPSRLPTMAAPPTAASTRSRKRSR